MLKGQIQFAFRISYLQPILHLELVSESGEQATYPNRRPYDSTSQECCEVDQAKQLGIFGNLLEYSVMNDGTCEAKKGGKVVQSVAGNPHLYFEVQKV